MEQEPA
jgi:hypothetical protein